MYKIIQQEKLLRWIITCIVCFLVLCFAFLETHEHGVVHDKTGFGLWWMSGERSYTFNQIWINFKPFKIEHISYIPPNE